MLFRSLVVAGARATPDAGRLELPAPQPQPDAPPRPQTPLLELLYESLQRARDTAEQAKLDGNTPARQRAERDMVEITDQIRKATKAQRNGAAADVFELPPIPDYVDGTFRAADDAAADECATC